MFPGKLIFFFFKKNNNIIFLCWPIIIIDQFMQQNHKNINDVSTFGLQFNLETQIYF